MKTKIIKLSILLGVIISMFIIPQAVCAETEGDYTYKIENNGAIITKCSYKVSGDVIIPDTLGGYPVTSIGVGAFEDCKSITSIVIPESIISIGDGAFNGCGNLKSVIIPNSVTSIGTCAFYLCENLTNIVIPNSVTNIGGYAFYCCYSLTNINIPYSVTSIGNSAFESCFRLTNISIPNSVTYIGCCAFSNCDGLTSMTIPASVTNIEDRVFSYCNSLTSISLPDSLTSIGVQAFYECTDLTNITIPDSITSIGYAAFSVCTSLTNITIPDGVTTIEGSVFDGCTSLTNIIIPNSVKSIGFNAFALCGNLTNITIPDSVTSIGEGAFYGCMGLTSITIPDGIPFIESNVFLLCTNLTKITIPDSVTSIGYGAFFNCESLTSITIPDSVTSIGGAAFGLCESLTNITMSNSVTSIGYAAFDACKSLTSITIPNSVTSIGEYAFDDCTALTDVYYAGSEEDWNNIYIGDDNAALTNATIHYNYKHETDDKEEVSPLPNATRTVIINFTGGQDIVYNADSNSYNMDNFTLIGTLENLCELGDWDREDYSAYNVKVELTLPDGFSFERNSISQSTTYTFDEITYNKTFTKTVYLHSPSTGSLDMSITVVGDNVNEIAYYYDFVVSKNSFEPNVYKANYLINSKIGNDMENVYIEMETPCQELYRVAVECGLGAASTWWNGAMNTLNTLDKPSSIVGYAFEEKDIYSAIILSMLESSVDYEFMEIIDNEIIKEAKKNTSLVTTLLKDLYNFDVIDADAVKAMTEKEKESFENALKSAYKEDMALASKAADITKIISNGIKYGKEIQSIVETIESYKSICSLSDSMKSVLRMMYDSCPNDNLALKAALFDCIAVMDSGKIELAAQMTGYSICVIGKDIAQAGVDKLWGSIKNSFSVAHPGAFVIHAAYTASKYITDVCFNADSIDEKFCKVMAVADVEDLIKTVYYDTKNNFAQAQTVERSKIYNEAVGIMFNMLNKDCDYAIEFANAVDSSLFGTMSALMGDSSVDDFKKSVTSIQTSCDQFREEVRYFWIFDLETTYPEQFEKYKYIVDDSIERLQKKYNVNCPVDVYVFDKNGVIVGSVVNNVPYCREDANITISVIGDRKTIYMYGNEYDIVYEGNDSGTMDITVTEYDESNTATRNVYFNNLELSEHLTYTSFETGTNSTENVYTLSNESNESIAPDFDSVTDAETETYTAKISGGYFADTMLISQELHSGENVDITAYVPEGYRFVSWTSDAECDVFDDVNSITTKITMLDCDVNITANLVSVPTLSISSITENSVTVKAKDCENILEGKIILVIYNENGALEQLKMEDYTGEITFTDLKLTKGKVKVMLWSNLTNLIPLTEIKEKMFYFATIEAK